MARVNRGKFEQVVTIVKTETETLKKAIDKDPANREKYESAIAYNEEVIRMSEINMMAIDVVDGAEIKPKAAVKEEKAETPKPAKKEKPKKKEEPVAEPAPAEEEEPSLDWDFDLLFGEE